MMMNNHPLDQTIDNECERWASTIAIALRTLRKHGFSLVQDPLAAEQGEADQVRQSHEAACVLLGLHATPENVGHQVVQSLGREMRENGAFALQQLRTRGHI